MSEIMQTMVCKKNSLKRKLDLDEIIIIMVKDDKRNTYKSEFEKYHENRK